MEVAHLTASIDSISLTANSTELSSPAMAASLKTFTRFSELPLELRTKIWRSAMPHFHGKRIITIEQVTERTVIYGQVVVEIKAVLHRSGEPLPNALLACTEALANSSFHKLSVENTIDTLTMLFKPDHDILRLSSTRVSSTCVLTNLISAKLRDQITHVELHGNWMDWRLHQCAVANLALLPALKTLSVTAKGVISHDKRAPPNINFTVEHLTAVNPAEDAYMAAGSPHTQDYVLCLTKDGETIRGQQAANFLFERVEETEERNRICETQSLIATVAHHLENIPDITRVRFDYDAFELRATENGGLVYVPRPRVFHHSDVEDGLVSLN